MNVWLLFAVLGIAFWLLSRPGRQNPESNVIPQVQEVQIKSPKPKAAPKSPENMPAQVSKPTNKRKNEGALANSRVIYNYDIVGESYRRDNLLTIINEHNAISIGKLHIEAILDPEPLNTFDKHAVRVLIDGKHVGYIPKTDSERITKLIKESGKGSVKVKARIGWDKNQTSQFIGVKIAFDSIDFL